MNHLTSIEESFHTAKMHEIQQKSIKKQRKTKKKWQNH